MFTLKRSFQFILLFGALATTNFGSASTLDSNQTLIEKAVTGELHPGIVDDVGRPLLITAIAEGTSADVKQLLNRDFDPNSEFSGIPAIFFTVTDACQPKKLETLIAAGANITAPAPGLGAHAIHMAAQHSNLRCLDLLVGNGADPSATDKNGESAYFYALDFSNEKAIQRLWELKVNPGTLSKHGYDVFHYAIISEKSELVRELLTRYLRDRAKQEL